jgi:type VI protein secretion system component VasF
MMNPALRPDASLPEFLAARARAASDGRLVVDVIVGCCAALGVAVWQPLGWLVLLGVSVCLAAFGAWGIVDRELRERENAPDARVVRLLSIVRVAVAALGALAAVTALFSVLGVVLGTWIC